MEIIKTGDLERIQTETTEDVVTAKLFMTIYGVGNIYVLSCLVSRVKSSLTGPNIAYSWYALGLRTLDDVRSRMYGIKLSTAQEVAILLGALIVAHLLHQLGLRFHKGS
jgi:DNA polymerase lambda